MKKLLSLTLITLFFVASSFAATVNKLNYSVANSFAGDFPKATKVTWHITEDFAKATFVNNNVTTEAFYHLDGTMIGISHATTIDDLPTTVKRNFAKKYGAYTVKEVIEFAGNEETTVYISAENESKTVILKVHNNGLEVMKENAK